VKLNDYLASKNLTLRAFAEQVGTNYSQVHRWAKGERAPSIVMAAKIREVTRGRVKPEDFMPGVSGNE
jgi:transcriptional regulator with XRE-family HTH domain